VQTGEVVKAMKNACKMTLFLDRIDWAEITFLAGIISSTLPNPCEKLSEQVLTQIPESLSFWFSAHLN